jgi:hypothetical protein
MEHLHFQHCIPTPFFSARIRDSIIAKLTDEFRDNFTIFQYDLDRIITITQVSIYWWMRGEEEELCRKWMRAIEGCRVVRYILVTTKTNAGIF